MKSKTSDSVNSDNVTCDRSPRRSVIPTILGIGILREGGAQEGSVYVQSDATVSDPAQILWTAEEDGMWNVPEPHVRGGVKMG